MNSVLYAQTSVAGNSKDRIHISADSLTADDTQKYAEFAGNVRAVQGDTLITADRLKIYYEKSKSGSDNKGQDSIKKIVASGNVKIKFEDIDSEASEAVYTTDDRVLVLNGPGAKVAKKDSGSTSAGKITVQRDSGKIKFEGGVQGVFFPGEKDLN